LAVELNKLKHLDFVVPGKLQANPDVVAMYFGGVSGETVYYPNIDLATIVPPDFDVTQRPWFVKAAPSQNPQHQAVWAAPYLDAALHGLVVTTSIPVFDAAGAFRGVIAMDVQLGRISDLISSIHVGASGYAFLIDRDKHLIALPEAGYRDLGVTAAALPLGEVMDSPKAVGVLPAGLVTILGKMSAGQGGGGLETVSIGGVDRFVIYRPVPEVGYSMALVVPSQELLAGSITAREQLAALSANTTRISLLLVGLILFLAIMASVWLSNTLTAPLAALTHAAQEISGGNLGAHISVQSRDEIGILSQTLNTMTRNLSDMIQSLERRVRDRTADLQVATEQANRRASQFEAITRVTSAISATRNVDELMPLVTTAISEQFGYYHVGVFLNDEASQNVYLIAANSEGGRKMLDRYHSLKIGEQGIVGFVAARGEPRVARNVGEDVVFFNNPDLPGTRSEAALPLRSGGQTIGVLDVQSTKEDAFTPDDLGILAVLADLVSLAIENTRLLETTQRSLVESETLYRQYVRGAWSRLQAEEQVEGYRYSPRGSVPVGRVRGEALTAGASGQSLASSNPPLKIPVSLRGQAIGELVVEGPPDQPWNQDQVDLVQAVADRVALSVENARLFGETDRRAERERLVAEIASKIRSTNDPQEMMQTALNELRSALGASQVEIITQAVPSRLGDEEQEPPPSAASAVQQPRPGSGAKR
jgi:GAF domain-containing protein/HAMP domain-containing protein